LSGRHRAVRKSSWKRQVSVLATMVLLLGTGGLAEGAQSSAYRAYSDGAWWNRSLPRQAPAHARTDALLAYLRSGDEGSRCLTLAGAGTGRWGQPVYWAGSDDRTYLVRPTDYPLPPELRTLRIPAQAAPAATSDAELVIFDRAKGYVVALWHARYDATADQWSAGGAAVTYLASNGLHVRTGRSDEPRNTGAWRGNNGATMMVRYDEVAAGRIRHVLKFAAGPEVSSRHIFPMIASDGGSRATDAPPQGLRLRIRPRVDLRAMGLSREALVIARALKRYGMYLGDSGGTNALKLEDTRASGRGQLWHLGSRALCGLPLTPRYWSVLPERYQPPAR